LFNQFGTIEKGKYADIIAVEANPLNNIEVMDRVDMVMKGGAFIKGKKKDVIRSLNNAIKKYT
jgi:imidazolonepropionase-like amidohydrolase